MAVFKNLLAAVVASITVKNCAAGALASKSSVSFKNASPLSTSISDAAFTLTITSTVGGTGSSLSSILDKHQVDTTETMASTTTDSNLKDVSSGGATSKEHIDAEDMTLSLSTGTSTTPQFPTIAIFPDTGVFGRPPPIETATTKYTTLTSPNFPLVLSNVADGTKHGRLGIRMHNTTLGSSITVTIPGIIDVTSTGGTVYATSKTTLPSSHKSSSSFAFPGMPGCPPPAGETHQHHHWSCPPTKPPVETFLIPLEGREEVPPTATQGPSPSHTWHGGEVPKLRQPTTQAGGYSFGTSLPEFTNLILTPWESTSTSISTSMAHQTSTSTVTQPDARFPTDLLGPPQPRDEAKVNPPLETSSFDGTGTSSIDAVTASTVAEPISSKTMLSDGSLTLPAETIHWTTTTLTCTTCGPFTLTKTTGYTSSTTATSNGTVVLGGALTSR